MQYNDKIPVIFILHAYQPITQSKIVLERIINNCYIPFFQNLIENPNVTITLNITGCLLEKLAIDYPYVLELLIRAINNGQVELTGSAFYHPILPLVSIDNQKYQIGKQKEIIDNVLGVQTETFFPPELAISKDILLQIIQKGYKTVIVPENTFPEKFGGTFVLDNGKKIFLLKRDKTYSNYIAFKHFGENVELALDELKLAYNRNLFPIILAMDLETFGEHHKEYFNFFFKLNKGLITASIKHTMEEIEIDTIIPDIISTSWSSSDEDIEEHIPFPLWNHPLNVIHQLLHSHLEILKQIKQYKLQGEWLDDYHASHYSCQFWWASRDWWGPEQVLEGIRFQRKTLLKMIENLSEDSKQILYNLSNDIIKRIIDIITIKEDKDEHSIHNS